MRINLVVPFVEKDAVKALGARWDSAKKIWYVKDVPDLTPFSRWIPSLAAAEESVVRTTPAKRNVVAAPARKSAGVITKSDIKVPGCACNVLPWNPCEHTISA